jgi:hypothetical protein
MITVETTEAGMRVTIPKDEVPPARLNSFLDWLRLEAVAGRSQMTAEHAGPLHARRLAAPGWAGKSSAPSPGR